ncbi:MarR family winged helix-turn-helix transcriptional regulator [Microvirga brassicacearum]|uniref:MarR family winged helix-turn-helix transcriptional regulator n=1 Tax=Microvirga brassicacearum TaxID=2580413 RepID=UPI0019138706|nr:MarR family winged helix-turn-helix transcriptional regulator [Microvirga brassicacearum]
MATRSTARKDEFDALVVLERFLPYRLNVLAALSSNALAQIYAERFGLSIPGWRVIATLGQYDVRTARDIAAHGIMHKSTVSRAVSALEERGLVVRRANQQDRREELLALTAQGRAIYASLAPQALAFEEQLVSVLSREEQRTLSSLMDKLTRHARAMAPDGEAGQ